MNPHDPHSDIGALLRSRQPDPRPSPGLERRIMHALPERRKSIAWIWFTAPPALAAVALLLSPAITPPEQTTAVTPTPDRITETPAAPAATAEPLNPLEREALALRRDARRAGQFLIDCLPSIPSGE